MVLNKSKCFGDVIFIGYFDRGLNFFGCIYDLYVDEYVVDLECILFGYI